MCRQVCHRRHSIDHTRGHTCHIWSQLGQDFRKSCRQNSPCRRTRVGCTLRWACMRHRCPARWQMFPSHTESDSSHQIASSIPVCIPCTPCRCYKSNNSCRCTRFCCMCFLKASNLACTHCNAYQNDIHRNRPTLTPSLNCFQPFLEVSTNRH